MIDMRVLPSHKKPMNLAIVYVDHTNDNVPVRREVLDESCNDEPFIANLLHKMAPAVDMELGDDMQGDLRSLARRD